jgi:hypothetical protein
MKIETAEQAAALAAQIRRVTIIIANIQLAINEQWPISALQVSAPAEGSSQPQGIMLDLLGSVTPSINDIWKINIVGALQAHQDLLASLQKQLDAL